MLHALKRVIKRVVPGFGTVRRMTHGPGRGLRFDAGASNPGYGDGDNELPVQQALAAHLQVGSVFYDIGANVGYFSVIAARLVGGRGQVLAFEPVPQNAAYVRRNARLNKLRNIEVIEAAVDQRCGQAEFCFTEYSGGSVLASADHRAPDVRRVDKVLTVTIDHCVEAEGREPPDVVKIDVEGAEHEVLLGMQSVLKKFRPVVVYEIDDTTTEFVDRKQRRCDALLEECGYRLERLDNSYPGSSWVVTHTVAVPA